MEEIYCKLTRDQISFCLGEIKKNTKDIPGRYVDSKISRLTYIMEHFLEVCCLHCNGQKEKYITYVLQNGHVWLCPSCDKDQIKNGLESKMIERATPSSLSKKTTE